MSIESADLEVSHRWLKPVIDSFLNLRPILGRISNEFSYKVIDDKTRTLKPFLHKWSLLRKPLFEVIKLLAKGLDIETIVLIIAHLLKASQNRQTINKPNNRYIISSIIAFAICDHKRQDFRRFAEEFIESVTLMLNRLYIKGLATGIPAILYIAVEIEDWLLVCDIIWSHILESIALFKKYLRNSWPFLYFLNNAFNFWSKAQFFNQIKIF